MQEVKSSADILAFTQDIWLSVIAEKWDGLQVLQQEQDVILKAFFTTEDFVLSNGDKADLLEVQSLNNMILEAVELHRSELASELQAIKAGKLKVNAYQSIE